MRSIKLYYWSPQDSNKINLGDHLSKLIVEAISGRNVIQALKHDCDMVAVGSVLWFVIQDYNQDINKPLHVWGSGLMSPFDYDESNLRGNIKYHSLRGELTKSIVGVPENLPRGDPGILVSKFFEFNSGKKYKYGIIPHHHHIESLKIKHLNSCLRSSVVIDLTDPDYTATLQKINACEYIISSSLHGLIIADSYGIPNFWLKTGELHRGNRFKFYDYFSTVGRCDYQVDGLKWIASGSQEEFFVTISSARLNEVSSNLAKSFPFT